MKKKIRSLCTFIFYAVFILTSYSELLLDKPNEVFALMNTRSQLFLTEKEMMVGKL